MGYFFMKRSAVYKTQHVVPEGQAMPGLSGAMSRKLRAGELKSRRSRTESCDSPSDPSAGGENRRNEEGRS